MEESDVVNRILSNTSVHKNTDIATTKLPNKLLFKKWAKSTPDKFRFAISYLTKLYKIQ
jgi:hypothetical protein